jgi:hypothetical protein
VLVLAGALALGLVAPICAAAETQGTYVNVKRFGANGSDSKDDEAAFLKAMAVRRPIYVPAGNYIIGSGRLRLPNGCTMFGAGLGLTKVNAALTIGSDCRLGGKTENKGITFGTPDERFYFKTGASRTTIRWCRFRVPGSSVVFDLGDWTQQWSDPVVRRRCHVHDITFARCEFEHSADDADLVSIWWDSRAGGGKVYDIQWIRCTFGVKDATGDYNGHRTGLIIQPSPPEHASDGPRPDDWADAANEAFDWSQVTHGAGMAIAGADFGFRLIGCRFVGDCDFVSANPCDYIRSWMLTTYPWYYSQAPHFSTNGTPAERAAAPLACTLKGVTVTDCWFGDDFRPEICRRLTVTDSPDEQGDAYNVSSAVLTHDQQLYGLSSARARAAATGTPPSVRRHAD